MAHPFSFPAPAPSSASSRLPIIKKSPTSEASSSSISPNPPHPRKRRDKSTPERRLRHEEPRILSYLPLPVIITSLPFFPMRFVPLLLTLAPTFRLAPPPLPPPLTLHICVLKNLEMTARNRPANIRFDNASPPKRIEPFLTYPNMLLGCSVSPRHHSHTVQWLRKPFLHELLQNSESLQIDS